MTTNVGPGGGRPPAELARTLCEGSPRWHLVAAEEAMDEGRLDVARASLARAKETIRSGSPDCDEARFVAVRLAVASVDYRMAAAEVAGMVERYDAADPVWNRRLRGIIEAAPRVFPAAYRTALLDLLPPVVEPGESASESAAFFLPGTALPDLPDEEPWVTRHPAGSRRELAAAEVLPPIPTVSPFERARAACVIPPEPASDAVAAVTDLGSAADEVLVLYVDETPTEEAGAPVFSGRVTIVDGEEDLTDADALRDRLVAEMLAAVSEEEGQLIFDTATTFLINRDFETAEVMFSAAMQVPALRVAACEGVMRCLVDAGRFVDAAATGAKAVRIFARAGDALLGIVYLQGVAAQELHENAVARACYARVAASPDASHFPELALRQAAVR